MNRTKLLLDLNSAIDQLDDLDLSLRKISEELSQSTGEDSAVNLVDNPIPKLTQDPADLSKYLTGGTPCGTPCSPPKTPLPPIFPL